LPMIGCSSRGYSMFINHEKATRWLQSRGVIRLHQAICPTTACHAVLLQVQILEQSVRPQNKFVNWPSRLS
jgi:hypothetical protein